MLPPLSRRRSERYQITSQVAAAFAEDLLPPTLALLRPDSLPTVPAADARGEERTSQVFVASVEDL